MSKATGAANAAISAYAGGIEHLHGALHVLHLRLHRQVLRWRAEHHAGATTEEMSGLYTSDADVDHLIARLYPSAPAPGASVSLDLLDRLIAQAEATHAARERAAQRENVLLELPLLSARLGLTAFERDVLLLGIAAEMDRRYERLFGYLNDDMTQRAPTAALACALFSDNPADRFSGLTAFAADAPLRDLRLIHLIRAGADAPLLASGYRLDESVALFLLGGLPLDPALRNTAEMLDAFRDVPILSPDAADALRGWAQVLAQGAAQGATHPGTPMIVNLHGGDPALLLRSAAYLAGSFAVGGLHINAQALAAAPNPLDLVMRIERTRLLLNAAPILDDPAGTLPTPLLLRIGVPCLLLTAAPWQPPPDRLDLPVMRLSIPTPDTDVRARLWHAELEGLPLDADADLLELADRFRLSAGQIAAAAASLRTRLGVIGRVRQRDLFAAAREGISRELRALAQPIETRQTWDDLVLPPDAKAQLHAVENWVRHRHLVLDVWQFARRTAQTGLAVLFSGPSGTGKTLSAGVLGRSLGLDVYRIDLSAVVSKYIGETEKNLEAIFTLAEAANAILFFDEADALFGKRSEVKDAHDRYANIEVSYLLQRMERYPGIAILASNLKANLDAAFLRRLHLTIEFPFPLAAERERLWRSLIPPEAPLADDVDFGFLAGQFSLTGGSIRNCALYAAFLAAGEGESIAMRHLIQAVARELDKLEQPVLRGDFGQYFDYTHNGSRGRADRRPDRRVT